MADYRRLLLATDFSNNNQAPIEQARIIQQKFKARLDIIHVIEPIPAYGYPTNEEFKSTLIDSAKAQLNKVGSGLKLPPQQIHLKFGSVKVQVLKLAEELNTDLIIIGSHGRHGLNRLLGSSAHSIVNRASCDVLTVRCK